jgi:hypothetical protein
VDGDGSGVDAEIVGLGDIPELQVLTELVERLDLVPETVLVAHARLAIDADVLHVDR